MRFSAALIVLMATSTWGCDSPKEGGGSEAAPSAASKPAVSLVVRSVALQKTISPPGKSDEDDSFSALDGKVYALVTADVALNSCADGEKVDSKLASIELAGGAKGEVVGGGLKPENVCVLCQATSEDACSGGSTQLAPFTFVFQVPEDADMSKAQMAYKDAKAPLSDGKLTDRRGNDELEEKIKAKKEQLAQMKKTLENTGTKARGELLIGEMEVLEKEIKDLEAKRK
jgi:phosphoribosylanthranilate isomerase